ncbi:MAG: M48 family metalloprotease [Litorimonas sp.]
MSVWSSQAQAAEPSVLSQPMTEYLATTERLEDIALRLAGAAGGQCANGWRHPGVSTHSRADYPSELQAEASRLVGDIPIIRRVTDPALAGRIAPGDVLLGLDGAPAASGSLALQARLSTGRIIVATGGTERTVRHDWPRLCYRPVRIVPGWDVSARTTADAVELSRGLLRYVRTEDELAFALAHELSHFMLGHPQVLARARAEGRRRPALSRQLEEEADRGAVFLMARAGYATGAGLDFIERSSVLRDVPLFGLSSHPSRSSRLRKMRTTLGQLPPPDADLSIRAFVDATATS